MMCTKVVRSTGCNICWAILTSLDIWRVRVLITIMSYTWKIYHLSYRNIGYKFRASFPNFGIRDWEPGDSYSSGPRMPLNI